MLEHFESAYRGIRSHGGRAFKTSCHEILRVRVRPVVIEADIAHEACKQSVTASRVEKLPTTAKQPPEHAGRHFGEVHVPLHDSRVGRNDGARIGFVEPMRRLGLQKATCAALKILHVVLAEHEMAKCAAHLGGTDSAFHNCTLNPFSAAKQTAVCSALGLTTGERTSASPCSRPQQQKSRRRMDVAVGNRASPPA